MSKHRTGTIFARIIARFGYTKQPAICKCDEIEHTMNAWGPVLCKRHINSLLTILKIQATALEYPFSETFARWAILLACSLSQKDRGPKGGK